MRRSVILDVTTGAVFQSMLAFSLFLLVKGHNAPGGGFAGGLVAGIALVLRYAQGGTPAVVGLLPVRPQTLLGAGLLVAGATVVAGFAIDGAALASGYLSGEVPLLGEVAFTTPLIFDIGVYLVVVGLVLGALRTLGQEPTSR